MKQKLEIYKDETIKRYFVESVQELIDSIESAKNKEKARIIAKMAYDALDAELKPLIKNTEILEQSFIPENIVEEGSISFLTRNVSSEENGCAGAVISSLSSVLMISLCVMFIKRKRGEN